MAKVLAISSQTVFGPVGNSASVPALQGEGHEVLALPTVLLSFHPGHGVPSGSRTPAALMREMLEKLDSVGALQDCSAVLTGYFADAEQVAVAAETVARLKRDNAQLMVLVDPVLGDDGALYVPQTVAEAVRGRLVPLATMTTPNAFELSFLTNMTVADQGSAASAAARLATGECLVTSVPAGDHLATLLMANGKTEKHVAGRLARVPHGTGDFLSGLYLANRLKHAPAEAFRHAMARLDAAIATSAGSAVLRLTG